MGNLADRCLDQKDLYPPEKPVQCEYSQKTNETFVIKCCKDADMCNAELKPELHVKPSVPGKTFKMHHH